MNKHVEIELPSYFSQDAIQWFATELKLSEGCLIAMPQPDGIRVIVQGDISRRVLLCTIEAVLKSFSDDPVTRYVATKYMELADYIKKLIAEGQDLNDLR